MRSNTYGHSASDSPSVPSVPSDSSSRLRGFSELIGKALSLMGPTARELAKSEALAAREIIWALRSDSAEDQTLALDNAWTAYGPEAFARAMSRKSWLIERPLAEFDPWKFDAAEFALPAHAALLLKAGDWRMKLLSMVPDERLRDTAGAKRTLSALWFGEADLAKRGIAEITPAMLMCVSPSLISSLTEWTRVSARLSEAGCEAPQGAELIACQNMLDRKNASSQKSALRAWAEAQQLSNVAQTPTPSLSRRARSL